MNSLVAGVNRRMFETISTQKDNLAKGDPKNIIDCLEACEGLLDVINNLTPVLARKILLIMTENSNDDYLNNYLMDRSHYSLKYTEFKTAVNKLTPKQKKELSNVFGINVYFHVRDEAVDKVIAKLKQAKDNYRMLTDTTINSECSATR